MKGDPIQIAAAIDAALTRRGGRGPIIAEGKHHRRRSLSPVTVAEAPTPVLGCEVFLVTTADARYPRMVHPAVDREILPPGIAETVADQLVHDELVRGAMDDEHDAVMTGLREFAGLLPAPVTLALNGDDHTGEPFAVFATVIDHKLAWRTICIQRIGHRSVAKTAERLIKEQTLRAEMLDAATGDRAEALLCCPVAARAIVADPAKWHARVTEDLAQGCTTNGFRDGVYRPYIHLKGARWRGDTLMADGEFPEAVRAAMVGRRLGEIVDHDLIPGDIAITGSAQRRGDGQIYIRTDATPVPMAPLFRLMGTRL